MAELRKRVELPSNEKSANSPLMDMEFNDMQSDLMFDDRSRRMRSHNHDKVYMGIWSCLIPL